MEINPLLNNPWKRKKKSQRKSKYPETNENENTTHYNTWDATKAVQSGKLTTKCLH